MVIKGLIAGTHEIEAAAMLARWGTSVRRRREVIVNDGAIDPKTKGMTALKLN